jgi:integrator complex subunit 1
MDHRQTAQQSPTFSWTVWSATVLLTALQYVDHWPVPLVYVYAVDAFGARSWVDDPDCSELVKILALVTDCSSSDQVEGSATTPQHTKDASAVAAAYRNFSLDSFLEENDRDGYARRPSLSSSSSVGPKSDDVSSSKDRDEKHRDGGASSSGEEDDDTEKDVLISESNDDESKMNQSQTDNAIFYPVPPRHSKLARVRNRYLGDNLEAAHEAIVNALQERIDQKSKQNSGLLQALPMFTSIPKVRYLVTHNLEKWLQSPALAGLSRTLFAATVENMKNVDPPLSDDLQSIDHILAMKLKANQFAAHMENVTAIAKRIPTATVANHIYANILQQSTEDGPSDESLSMLAAIHNALPAQISYEALAYSILMLLVRGRQKEKEVEKQTTRPFKLIRHLRQLLRSIAAKLAPSFDGFQVLSAFLELEINEGSWSVKDEEDKARLMFQCVTLYVVSIAGIQDPFKSMDLKRSTIPPEMEDKVRYALQKCRRVLLRWCCGDYGPSYARRRRKKRDADIFDGSAAPDFWSAIGPSSQVESVPLWLSTMRCLLLIEEVDSDLMNHFLSPPDASDRHESGWALERERIRFCASFGADIDDEMISVILASVSESESDHGMSPDMSLKLLEHLFESCGKRRGAILKLSDPDLVWEMYKLAHYTPSKELISLRISEYDDNEGEHAGELNSLPRLAFTGLWWRVTVLGLVMCGSNPEKIGSVVWRDHPTICSLIKMVTSGRYRFPTVDCDEEFKRNMKDAEQSARDEEARVAELLFLPPKEKKNHDIKRAGLRMSSRLLKQQQEKEAAAKLVEANHRKKLVRSAQKAIMLWDPDGPARKPPRECAELLVSADSIFDLFNSFQRCKKPDFLLSTIGGTSRSAIERAYDWLIPIMARVPDTIGRLPSSTSCFLLLRAYGAEGERREQLRKLSSPLLYHVRDSLRGSFGQAESIEAFDILLADVGSYHSERRKSARKVLQDALGNIMLQEGLKLGSSAWMMNIFHVEHAQAIVPIAISHLTSASKYERGKVLKSLVMALHAHISFALERNIPVARTFPLLLSLLVSQRPNVFAEAIDTFSDFRSLVVKVIHDELIKNEASAHFDEAHRDNYVSIKLRKGFDKIENKVLPMSLLETTCIVLSVWSGDSYGNDEEAVHVKSLVDVLMLPSDGNIVTSDDVVGLASAINMNTKTAAMTVDSVSLE